MAETRLEHLVRFYAVLDELEKKNGGSRTLGDCHGRMDWPKRGVYFFREAGERRSDTGTGPRVVRVGTHALKAGGSTTLWGRLSAHRGQMRSGGGNHRGSIFRLIVGTALIGRDNHKFPTWGKGSSAGKETTTSEVKLECAVSQIIGKMPFLWLSITDEPGPESLRGEIERNSIAPLSNFKKASLDPPSQQWLGHHCDRERVRASGLWNQNHVDENYDPRVPGRSGETRRANGKSMIVVIQCAARKSRNAGHLVTTDGKPVTFVAHPEIAPNDDKLYARPDDAGGGKSWRNVLLAYNRQPDGNPLGLLPAYRLYQNPVYERLVDKLGTANVYILSAGWGLIRSDFLTPYYDITFSAALLSTLCLLGNEQH